MRHGTRKKWVVAAIPALAVVLWLIATDWKSVPQRQAEALIAKSKAAGYKMDAGDFDLDIGEAARRATGIFTNVPFGWPPYVFYQAAFTPPVGSNSAVVLWKETEILGADGSNVWPNVRAQLDSSSNLISQLHRILDAPKFRTQAPGKFGPYHLWPHLHSFVPYASLLASEASLALHDGRRDDAWIALRSLSRLATRWEPEPFEASQFTRLLLVDQVQKHMWNALQDDAWSEDQLNELQGEWERLDLFSRVPEAAAAERVKKLIACDERRASKGEREVPALWETVMNSGGSRVDALKGWFGAWNKERNYLRSGVFDDEIALIEFFNEREDELRWAVASPTFVSMKERISTTNQTWVRTSPESQVAVRIRLKSLHEDWLGIARQGMLGWLATTESRRRMVVTALALKRYAVRNGRLPETLGQLVPGLLNQVPADYMDAQPLRYRSRADGSFLLYSVGRDCKDDGGDQRSPPNETTENPHRLPRDIVWPFAASEEDLRLDQEASEAWERMEKAKGTNLMILEWLRRWGIIPFEQAQEVSNFGGPP